MKAPIIGPRAGRPVFRVEERHGIFHVTLDGRFFGDYRSRRWAMDGVEQNARRAGLAARTATDPAATGGTAQVIHVSRTGVVISDDILGPF